MDLGLTGRVALVTTIREFGRLDLLVNNAGATKGGNILALTDDKTPQRFRPSANGAIGHNGTRPIT